jgi:tetratricopeptide (TPR) repeat protein
MKLIQIIFFTLVANSVFAQKDITHLMNQVDTLFKQEKPFEALAIMKLIVNQKDTANGYARYKTRIGLIYDSLDSISEARKWFLSVMNDSLIDDSVEDFWLGEWEVRGNYKHFSCYQMAISYYKQNDFDSSIKYYKMALDTYPYYHFSGSDINKNKVTISKNIADLYSKKGDLTSAFSFLLPFFNDFTIYSDRAEYKAAYILKEHNLEQEFIELMEGESEALIEKERIVIKLAQYEIVLNDMTGMNKSTNEIEESANFFWLLIMNSKIIEELKIE